MSVSRYDNPLEGYCGDPDPPPVNSSTRLEFRPLTRLHLAVIMKIESEAYPEPWSAAMFREEMHSSRSYFRVAMADGLLVGYCGFWHVLDEAHITSVTVDHRFRRFGFGKQQLRHLIEVAREREILTLTLEVRESNQPARALYESHGFRDVGLRKGYYAKTREDAIVMTKKLP